MLLLCSRDPGGEGEQTFNESVAERTIRATLAARDDLMAGFTAERGRTARRRASSS